MNEEFDCAPFSGHFPGHVDMPPPVSLGVDTGGSSNSNTCASVFHFPPASVISASPEGHEARPTSCVETARPSGETLTARSPEYDLRVCYHEQSHATVIRILTGPLGGVTAEPGPYFDGLCWSPGFIQRDMLSVGESDEIASECSELSESLPSPGESRENCADVYLHCFRRVVESVAGSEGERLFLPDGDPLASSDDGRQAMAYASLITTSPGSAAAFIDACRVEARALLTRSSFIVHALAAELQIARTMDGEAIDACIERAVAAKAVRDEIARRSIWKAVEQNAAEFAAGFGKPSSLIGGRAAGIPASLP